MTRQRVVRLRQIMGKRDLHWSTRRASATVSSSIRSALPGPSSSGNLVSTETELEAVKKEDENRDREGDVPELAGRETCVGNTLV